MVLRTVVCFLCCLTLANGSTICDYRGATADTCADRYIGVFEVQYDATVNDTVHDVRFPITQPGVWVFDALVDQTAQQIHYRSITYAGDGAFGSAGFSFATGLGETHRFPSQFTVDELQIRTGKSDWLSLTPSLEHYFLHDPLPAWPETVDILGSVTGQPFGKSEGGPFVATLQRQHAVSRDRIRIDTKDYPNSFTVEFPVPHGLTYEGPLHRPVSVGILEFDEIHIRETILDSIVLRSHPWQAGDANTDNAFNQSDLVKVLAEGKYLTSKFARFEQGDFDGNGGFDQLDLVAALQTGNYLQGPYLAVVPEPSTWALTLTATLYGLTGRRLLRKLKFIPGTRA